MTTITNGQCRQCTHWRKTAVGTGVCAAFPDGIPVDVYNGVELHDKPLEGDNGVRFELRGRFEPYEYAEPVAE